MTLLTKIWADLILKQQSKALFTKTIAVFYLTHP